LEIFAQIAVLSLQQLAALNARIIFLKALHAYLVDLQIILQTAVIVPLVIIYTTTPAVSIVF
jgi:hypothetical protein